MVIFHYMTVSSPKGWALEALMDKQYNYHLIRRFKNQLHEIFFLDL